MGLSSRLSSVGRCQTVSPSVVEVEIVDVVVVVSSSRSIGTDGVHVSSGNTSGSLGQFTSSELSKQSR